MIVQDYKFHPQPTSLRNALNAAKVADIRGSQVLDCFCGTGTCLIAALKAGAEKAIGSDVEDYSFCLRPEIRKWLKNGSKNIELHWEVDGLESIKTFEHDILFIDPPSPVSVLGGTQISVVRDTGLHGNQIRQFWQERISKKNLMGKGQKTISYVVKLVKMDLQQGKRVIANLFTQGKFSYLAIFKLIFKVEKLYKNWHEVFIR
jgi:16S rRNA G966 N2-methylase RsmD